MQADPQPNSGCGSDIGMSFVLPKPGGVWPNWGLNLSDFVEIDQVCPALGRRRTKSANVARNQPKWGLASNDIGPAPSLTAFEPTSAKCCPISANFDHDVSGVDQQWPGFGTTWPGVGQFWPEGGQKWPDLGHTWPEFGRRQSAVDGPTMDDIVDVLWRASPMTHPLCLLGGPVRWPSIA